MSTPSLKNDIATAGTLGLAASTIVPNAIVTTAAELISGSNPELAQILRDTAALGYVASVQTSIGITVVTIPIIAIFKNISQRIWEIASPELKENK